LISRRSPSEIALELLNSIDKKNCATKWELTKILGNTEQFRHWVEDYLLKDGILNEHHSGRITYYTKTERGELFHKLLRNGNIMKSFLRISGRRLRSR
jgi:predicted transcriptional regulator